MPTSELFVLNLNPHFTGVSATAGNVMRHHLDRYAVQLVGHPLPGLPAPIGVLRAVIASRGKRARVAIWHTRRNGEMQMALLARDVLRLPIRIVHTTVAMRKSSGWSRYLMSKMDAIIAVTDQAASFAPNVWAVVPHGVNCDDFRPAADRAALWAALGHGGLRGLAAVGRVRPEKGTDVFVDAMILALPDLPDVVALVVGLTQKRFAPFQAELQARIDAAGLSGRIKFIGEIAPEKLTELVPALSLVVPLPRYEGYGMTPLEAMAAAVPIVASDAGFFREFVGDDSAGRVVAIGDAEGAALAVKELLCSPAAYDRASAGAVARARGAFGIAREADAIAQVYERLWSGEVRR